MGNMLEGQEQQYSETKPHQAKLLEVIKISQEQQDKLIHLIKSRGKSKSQYLCTAIDFRLSDSDGFNSSLMCQQFKQLTIFYENFDLYLDQIKQSFPLNQIQVQNIILSVCQALAFLIDGPLKSRHGDINLHMICKKANAWKLIDNSFLRQGISAYEKVLLGQDGFISPYQMEKIRHGFVRQSPALKQSDDIFALGMTCLEIMSGRPSKFCYKQTYVKFNQKQIQQRLIKISSLYEPYLVQLVRKMINLNQQERPKIKQILSNSSILRHSKKTSLRSYNRQLY